MRQVVLLSGGVGGARLARGLAALESVVTTVVVNVGDDDVIHGLRVSPDLDTVVYTLAQVEGPEGWGRADDTFSVIGYLAELGADTRFRIGDRDLATNLFRTDRLLAGASLAEVTREISAVLGVRTAVIPVTNDPLRTVIVTTDGTRLSFQDYFVKRGQRDDVRDVRFQGAGRASAAPGVVEAITSADGVVIGPSNPPLSIWPLLAVSGVAEAVASVRKVVAVSPLIGGKALKGPADRVMASLGLPGGNAGVVAAYPGLLTDLIIDTEDAAERPSLVGGSLKVHVADTRIADRGRSQSFADWLVELL